MGKNAKGNARQPRKIKEGQNYCARCEAVLTLPVVGLSGNYNVIHLSANGFYACSM